MKNLLLLIFLATSFAFSQNNNTTNYKFGHNGIELIVKTENNTIIVSTFNSKKEIKEDIADKVYKYYIKNNPSSIENITIEGIQAKVSGKFELLIKGKTILLNFYYEKIEWHTGGIEIYAKS